MGASYLWRRGARWFFQITPPIDLHRALGRTPLRLPLPVTTAKDARRFARVLAGHAVAEFNAVAHAYFKQRLDDEDHDSPALYEQSTQNFARDGVMRGLQSKIDELHVDTARVLGKAGIRYDGQTKIEATAREVVTSWKALAHGFCSASAAKSGEIESLKEQVEAMRLHSDALHRDLYQDIADLYESLKIKQSESDEKTITIEVEAAKFATIKQSLEERVSASQNLIFKLSEQQININEKVFRKIPTLKEAGDNFIERKTGKLTPNSKEYAYFRHRLDLFLDIIGNLPLDQYKMDHLADFADALRYVPANHSVKPEWRNKSIKSIIEENRRGGRPAGFKGLSQKTVSVNYLGKIKTIFRYACANENIQNPFKDSSVFISKMDGKAVVRAPLPYPSAATLFRFCAKQSRPDEFFLPLLGALTGARLSELVYLQSADIKESQSSGHYIADITNALIQDDGEAEQRPVKNDGSKRFIALHDCLLDMGFIEWARAQDTWLFPDLHDAHVKHPGDAASKRFQRISGHLRFT